MNKDEILAMSREENKDHDPLRKEVSLKGANLTVIVTSIASLLLYIIEETVTLNKNYAIWALICILNFTQCLYTGIKLKNKWALIGGVSWGILTITALVGFGVFLSKNVASR